MKRIFALAFAAFAFMADGSVNVGYEVHDDIGGDVPVVIDAWGAVSNDVFATVADKAWMSVSNDVMTAIKRKSWGAVYHSMTNWVTKELNAKITEKDAWEEVKDNVYLAISQRAWSAVSQNIINTIQSMIDDLDVVVNALPNDTEKLINNSNFKSAVAIVSPPVKLPDKWAFANITNANGSAVSATDIGATPMTEDGVAHASAFNGSVALVDYIYTQDAGAPWINVYDGILYSDTYNNKVWRYGGDDEEYEIAVKGDIPKLWAFANVTNANGNAVSAEDVGALPLTDDGDDISIYGQPCWNFNGRMRFGYLGEGLWGLYSDIVCGLGGIFSYSQNAFEEYPRIGFGFITDDDLMLNISNDGKAYYAKNLEVSDDREIAVKGDISATNPTFSNAVLAVGFNIDTNSVAMLNELAATFGDFPIEGTATTVGGLLAALAAALAWLKKNKVGQLEVDEAKAALNARIDIIEATSHPNMGIVGAPTFREGVVSVFTANDYLVFPTEVSVGENAVDFFMSFTTGANVTTQQNLMDSWCGLAFAVQNGGTVTAVSQNGTTFVTATSAGTISANTAYRLKLEFRHAEGAYTVATYLATGSGDYAQIGGVVTLTAPVFPTATYWGGANPKSGQPHIFGGSINLSECHMEWNGKTVWRGYDELPTVKFDPTAEEPLDTSEKIVAHILAQFDNGETEAF